jgi:signal transduction histidine kinase
MVDKDAQSAPRAEISLASKRSTKVYLSEAVEAVLLLGDYQKRSNQPNAVTDFCKTALGKIDKLATFDQAAIFTVDPDSSDLSLAAAAPPSRAADIEGQVDDLIDQGTVAWALRERRGIMVSSQDGEDRLFLHVIATYARIRGLFIGVQSNRKTRIPTGALELLSLFMRSLATSLEGIEYIDLLASQNRQLQEQVDEKMRLLLRRERELANTRKLNAIGSLAGGIAHEYNNALMSLMGYTELATLACSPESKLGDYLAKMMPVLERMSQLTNQLLAYSQGIKYRKVPVDLPRLITRILESMQAKLGSSIIVETEFGGGELIVEGDRNQLHQALTAMITNAGEALGEGGAMEIRIRVHRIDFDRIAPETENLDRLTPGDHLQVEIMDTGCGMDKETRERMFEPFYSTKFAGRGLSLAAVHGIIENHRGVIDVESRPGHGTRLRLYIPVSQGEAADGDPVARP